MMATENEYLGEKDLQFATKAIHVGTEPEQWSFMELVPPIGLATSYKKRGIADAKKFEYSRGGNPSRYCLEQALAALDDAKFGLTFASGLGASTAIVSLLSTGDHILCVDDVYGGTSRYFRQVSARMNIEPSFEDATDVEMFISKIKQNTKMLWIESPSNPLLKVIDIKAIAEQAHHKNKDILVVVDNTFLTSYFQKPLNLGADIAMYSCTKYINGHADVVMGAAMLNDEEVYKQLKFLQNACGIVPSPFDCYLVLRSIKTLQLRMEQHMKNGLAVAKFLESHPQVKQVIHPGLPSHPNHDLVKKTWLGCSGMCSFYLHGGLEESKIFLKSLKVFTLAESLGGYESLAELPSAMTHASVPETQRLHLGITDNLIRLSVGLESEEDLIEDLDQALSAILQK